MNKELIRNIVIGFLIISLTIWIIVRNSDKIERQEKCTNERKDFFGDFAYNANLEKTLAAAYLSCTKNEYEAKRKIKEAIRYNIKNNMNIMLINYFSSERSSEFNAYNADSVNSELFTHIHRDIRGNYLRHLNENCYNKYHIELIQNDFFKKIIDEYKSSKCYSYIDHTY